MQKRMSKDAPKLAPSKTNSGSAEAKRAAAGLIKVSKGVKLGALKIKDLINEGRS